MPYTPTVYVNDSSPDLNATNLNKGEVGIQTAQAAAEAAAAVAAAALPTPGGSDGQFLQRAGGLWVPHTLVAADIPSLAASKITGGVALQVIDDLTVAGAVLATYDTNTRLGGNIPATYKDILLVVTGKSDTASDQFIQVRVNNNSAANYHDERVGSSAAVTTAAEDLAQTSWVAGLIVRSAGQFATSEIKFPNYNSPFDHVGFISEAAAMSDITSGKVFRYVIGGGHSTITTAITRIAAFPQSGNFGIGTRFTLYGHG